MVRKKEKKIVKKKAAKKKAAADIMLAKTAGFCMGVKRAMSMAWRAAEEAEDRPIYTYGELIHNPQAIERLRENGIRVADDKKKPEGGTVIIRAHGISPEVRERLEKCKVHILDATCPHVKKVQSIIEEHSRAGYYIVILGDKGHAEVMGLLGFVKDGIAINSPAEIKKIPKEKKVCIVAQTTQNEGVFNDLTAAIKKHCSASPDIVIFNTICRATHIRQEEVLRMAREVDAMVIVGGYNSANTVRLATICREQGTPTFHIEVSEELDLKKLGQYTKIGISAGASTPDWIIEDVMKTLGRL